jgi:broad specificity phosphatase PhoE
MLHYIRHGEKEYKNSESEFYKHDPGLKEIGVIRAKKIALKLIEIYGLPTRIISSPFRRARETAAVMNMMLKKPFREIVIDRTLSEYLGNHHNISLDVTKATSIHNPPHPELFDDMKKRVKKHMEKTNLLLSENPKENIWFITHGLIIRQIASHVGIKTVKTLPCLSCFTITETSEMLKGDFIVFRGDLKHEKDCETDKEDDSLIKPKITKILQRSPH